MSDTKTTKSSTTSSTNTVETNLRKEIATLKAQLAAACVPSTVDTINGDVSLVYTSDSLGVVKVGNTELNCTRYGEEFVLSRQQFDEVVGRYRDWFDSGVLSVSPRNIAVAAAKGLRTSDELGLTANILNSLGTMSVEQIESLWKSLTLDSQRLSIVTFVKRKIIEKNTDFYNREKIDLLNRLTNGGFNSEADEISGRQVLIAPTDMMKAD